MRGVDQWPGTESIITENAQRDMPEPAAGRANP